MACLGYVRVSTDRQADEGQSLGAQQRVIQGYAMQQGWTVDEIFVECGVSGSTPLAERPQGQRLLTRLAVGDIVIIPKLDRMFRSALNALEVLQQLRAEGASYDTIAKRIGEAHAFELRGRQVNRILNRETGS